MPGTTPGKPEAIREVDDLRDPVLAYEEAIRILGLERLHPSEAPELVVWGRQDRLVSFAHTAEFGRLIAGSCVEIVDECGRIPQLEQPEKRPDPEALEQLRRRGVEVEAMPTDEAVRRYGGLDPGRTAAAPAQPLHLTCARQWWRSKAGPSSASGAGPQSATPSPQPPSITISCPVM